MTDKNAQAQCTSRTIIECFVATFIFACQVVAAQETIAEGSFSDTLSSGGQGPEMVILPAGSFRMGCLAPYAPDGYVPEDCQSVRFSHSLPAHEVRIPQPFGLSKYEVTFGEWDACVVAGGCNGFRPENPGFHRGAVHDRSPVVNVSWDDAQAYVSWLSKEAGQTYRLPSEAEWEYAARAGTAMVFAWGNEEGQGLANCEDAACGDDWRYTAPAGSFLPNAFGLHDMHGNVREWVEDCWNDSYEGAPSDGSAWLSGDCSQSVTRGGSWYRSSSYMRSAYRLERSADYRSQTIGFRVARILTP